MKAITLWQPWASLLACGAKKYETRSWATSYRGPIAIHAAQKDIHTIMISLPHNTQTAMYASLYKGFGIKSGALKQMPFGCIIATAELVNCHVIRSYIDETAEACFQRGPDDYELITGDESLFGDWTSGRYAWEFVNITILPEPISVKGARRIWNWSGGTE